MNTLPRYWLLDWHGRVLDHDLLHDRITTQDFTPGRYPGIYFTALNPAVTPFTVELLKMTSLPMPLPRLQARDAENGLVALANLDSAGHYAISIPNEGFKTNSPNISDWERFLILSEPMMVGMAILMMPNLCAVHDESGQPYPPLLTTSRTRGQLGDVFFPLAQACPSLERVAHMKPGEELTIELPSDPPRTFTFKRH